MVKNVYRSKAIEKFVTSSDRSLMASWLICINFCYNQNI